MTRLAVVITHPIQYNIPWLIRLGNTSIRLKVFFTWEQAQSGTVYDPGFAQDVKWDIPLMNGYEFQFVKNIARKPGSGHFWGIINPDLIGEIEKWKPEALLVFGWSFYSHLRCLLHFSKKIPILFRGDSVMIHGRSGFKKILRKIFLTWVYKHVDFGLYAGALNKDYFLAFGLKEEQLIFSPQAIDVLRFWEPDEKLKAQANVWKRELRIPPHYLTIISAAKMTRVKNLGFILDLAKACRHLPVRFVLAGNGPLRGEIEARGTEEENITLLDFQNQRLMPVVYRLGDIYIMPSVSETWGLAVNEAMACGLPVMVADTVGCAPELVFDHFTGMVFGLDDVKKCVDFIEEMTKNRGKVAEMGENARTLIKNFTFNEIVERIQKLLERL